MNKNPQYNQQTVTEPKQCKSEVEEICIYKTWKVSVIASLSEKNSGFHAII